MNNIIMYSVLLNPVMYDISVQRTCMSEICGVVMERVKYCSHFASICVFSAGSL